MPEVNPEILTWARETAGLTPEDAVKKLNIRAAYGIEAEERLAALETGAVAPTRPMLIKMAKQYHRPLLAFYLSKPPRKGDRGADFRTLSTDRSATDDAILDALIRDVTGRQSMVRAVLEDEDEAEPVVFVNSHEMSDGWQAIIESLRALLNVKRTEYRAQSGPDDAFAVLRSAAESAGVFVLLKGNLGTHHTEIGTEVFRGFSIADEIAPFVVINEYDARPAWSFTLLHELVHLLLGQTGISGARTENDIERFCDDIAGRFFLHDREIRELSLDSISSTDAIADQISDFAGDYNLSRTMVAYRAYRIGEIDQPTYGQLSILFRQQWLANRTNRREHQRRAGGGGDYYVTRRHRTGNSLIALVGRMMAAGALSTTKAATVLGVKPHQVQSLVELG